MAGPVRAGHAFDELSGEGPVLAKGLNGKAVVRFNGRGSLGGSYDFGSGMSSHSLLLLARWTDKDPAACQRVFSSPTHNWAFGYVDDDRGWIGDNW
jgi:hypothetical protein